MLFSFLNALVRFPGWAVGGALNYISCVGEQFPRLSKLINWGSNEAELYTKLLGLMGHLVGTAEGQSHWLSSLFKCYWATEFPGAPFRLPDWAGLKVKFSSR